MAVPQAPLYTTPPIVGVGVVVRNGGQVLLGLRQGSHGAGQWGLPGGKADPGEGPLRTAVRELYEEHAIQVDNVRPLPFWSYDEFPAFGRHFATLFVACDWLSGIPVICEPDKCADVGWFDAAPTSPLPRPIFGGVADLHARGLLLHG